MPFRSKGRTVWKTRFFLPDQRGGSQTCGTSDYQTACAIEAMVRIFKRRLQWSMKYWATRFWYGWLSVMLWAIGKREPERWTRLALTGKDS